MDLGRNMRNQFRRSSFTAVRGVIVDMMPTRNGGRRRDGCVIFVTVEDTDGNTVNFVMDSSTFVVDYTTLKTGMTVIFWYRTDAPVPLIYPPRYDAVVVAREQNAGMIDVSFYDSSLLNEEQTLQLKLDRTVELRTPNNQIFQGNPGNHNLVVIYATSTRSMPAQTTPSKIVVLCEPG